MGFCLEVKMIWNSRPEGVHWQRISYRAVMSDFLTSSFVISLREFLGLAPNKRFFNKNAFFNKIIIKLNIIKYNNNKMELYLDGH